MTRVIRNWTPDRVEDAPVAPHRYTWDRVGAEDDAPDWKSFIAAVPYKEGEVVYVARDGGAALARIVQVWFERDRFGDRRATFRVQFATAKGFWSKCWERTYPGFIQRGYHAAGLAPDYKG